MTGRRSILIFWTLLLVPALILAGVAFRLLSHEQERIRQKEVDTLLDQARVIARSMDLSIETVQENLTGSLLDIDSADIRSRLISWEKRNPLVRNVFVYLPEKGLEYPEQTMAATREERQFVDRFAPLFSGRIPFGTTPSSEEGQTPLISSRKKLYALSRESKPSPSPSESGWIPWFSENRLYILGWVQKSQTGPIYGVELELMTLLSRLVAEFPDNSHAGTALVLTGGSGSPIHQAGPLRVKQEKSPAGRIMVSSHFPHWSILVFTDQTPVVTQSFLIISLILVAILLTVIVSSGILITRLTLAKIKDAREKTSFVASVSHELKTPLTSIRMYAELLLSKRVNAPDKKQHYLEVIVGESSRLTRLINNVLDFGKLEQGKKKYHSISFDMRVFLEELIATHTIRIQKTGLEIIKEFSPGSFPVNTDRDAMEQAVLNLLDNALKYAGQGQFIKFILAREKESILITLQDDGPGISPQAGEAVFEKFFRENNSLTAPQPGSGLGLNIARQMLRDLGGNLTFDPLSQKGACFTIRIPIHETD